MTDLRDDELGRALRDLSGDPCDVDDALGRVDARVRRIRRRRMDVVAGVILAALIGGFGLAARAAHESAQERPSSVDTVTIPTSSPSTTVDPSTSAAPAVVAPAAATPEPPTAAAPDPSAAPATDAPVATDEPATSAASRSKPASTAASGPASWQQTFESRGGQVTVRVSNGSLTVAAVTPRTGYAIAGTVASGGHVEVTFASRGNTSSVAVDLVDGRLLPTITGDGTDGSTDPSHDRTSTSAPNSPPASSPSTTTDRSFGRDPRRDRTTDTSRW
jgi:hypothetical protein